MKNINVNTIKSLVPVCPNKIVFFCRCAARLIGKVALREQLNYEASTRNWSSLEAVEADRVELKQQIVKEARLAAKTIRSLNVIADKQGLYPLPLQSIDELSISDFIEVVNVYIDDLIADSEFRAWTSSMALFDVE